MTLAALLGAFGGLCSLIAYGPYAYSIYHGPTKPQRATWFIWILSDILIYLTYKQLGANESIWIMIAYILGTVIIFLISLKRGSGGANIEDILCFISVIGSFFLWWYTNNPFYAMLTSLTVVLLGIIPTMNKIWDNPYSENVTAYGLWFIGSTLSFIAVKISPQDEFTLYIAPLTFMTLQAIAISCILIRRIIYDA